jgi:hypothetical protein
MPLELVPAASTASKKRVLAWLLWGDQPCSPTRVPSSTITVIRTCFGSLLLSTLYKLCILVQWQYSRARASAGVTRAVRGVRFECRWPRDQVAGRAPRGDAFRIRKAKAAKRFTSAANLRCGCRGRLRLGPPSGRAPVERAARDSYSRAAIRVARSVRWQCSGSTHADEQRRVTVEPVAMRRANSSINS